MTLHKAFENLTAKRGWYKVDGEEIIPASTAQSLKSNYYKGLVKDDKIQEVLALFGYTKVKEEEWKRGSYKKNFRGH